MESASSISSANKHVHSAGTGGRHFPPWEFGRFLLAVNLTKIDAAEYVDAVWLVRYEIRMCGMNFSILVRF